MDLSELLATIRGVPEAEYFFLRTKLMAKKMIFTLLLLWLLIPQLFNFTMICHCGCNVWFHDVAFVALSIRRSKQDELETGLSGLSDGGVFVLARSTDSWAFLHRRPKRRKSRVDSSFSRRPAKTKNVEWIYALQNVNYELSPSTSASSSSQSPEVSQRARSLDLYGGKTSFRVDGTESEFEVICETFGSSGIDEFAISPEDYDAMKVRSSPRMIGEKLIFQETEADCGDDGSVIHDWQKGELLGRGTFGSVYEGIADGGFFFAVKEVSLLDQGVEGKQCIIQLEQEIALLSQFEHENIVRYYGTEKDAAHLYIFLELVTQGSLLRLYQKYDLRVQQVSGYTRQIVHGLKYLHDRNVIHRDIKCANILVHANGLVKLADFGLAKVAKLNDVKSCKGTAFWMAPEVVRSQGYGIAADIWSLGCTVLEMMTRRFPYSGLEHMAALYRIGQGERPFIPDTLSSGAQDFILQCLQVNPSLRPTAAELLDHPFVKQRLLPSSSGVASAHSFGW